MSRRRAETFIDENAPVFAALGEPARLRLVERLSAEGPLSIAALTRGAQVTRQAVTKHLNVLAGAGVVHDFRRGRERIWELETQRLDEARQALDRVSRRWTAALERLRVFVED